MRPFRAWALYLAAVFVGGALLAPWLHALVQIVADALPDLRWLAGMPFHRYVSRCLMVIALGGLWPLAKSIGLRSLDDLGFAPLSRNWGRVAAGFGVGFLSFAFVLVLVIAGDGRSWNGDRTVVAAASFLTRAVLLAIVVSLIEETIFRGGLFGTFRRAHAWKIGLVASSLVYAAVHFLDRARYDEPVTWWSGLAVLGRMWTSFGDPSMLLPRFLTLALAGGVLALAYKRTGNLWFGIGLHAGWIFWLKSYVFLTTDAPSATTWFWGTRRLVDGWLAAAVVAAVVFLVWALVKSNAGNDPRNGNSVCKRTINPDAA